MPPELRRFYHFRGLTVRGLKISKQQSLLNCYYSIHEVPPTDKDPLGEPIYVSEVIYNSLNPQWCTIPLSLCARPLDRFLVYIWDCSGATIRHIMKTTVVLSTLMFIESEEEIVFPPNTIFFHLFDGLYCSASVRKTLIDSKQILPLPSNIRTSRGQRMSFPLNTFSSILKQQEELQQKKAELLKLSESIQAKLESRKPYFEFVSKRNTIEDQKEYLALQIEQKKQAIDQDKLQLAELSKALLPRVNNLKEAELKLAAKRKQMELDKKNLDANLLKFKEVLFCQKRNTLHLIKELGQIYKITRAKLPDNTTQWNISGFPLPHSTFDGFEEEQIAVALGHTCHLIFSIAKYLEVPLRYPMIPKCSRSSISDPITTKGQYPLYSRGVDSARFQYAVFLLNKNIEQLVESQEIDFRIKSAPQLRETLPNLYKFLLALSQKRNQLNSIAKGQTLVKTNTTNLTLKPQQTPLLKPDFNK